jgi:hypothetical protein
MLIWLASYPRSGNTFFRVLLRQVYGIATYDLHEPDADRPEYEPIIGNARLDRTIAEMHRDDRLHIVKTHDLPNEDYPAIYLVRDGRDAVASYAHFALDPKLADDRGAYLDLLRNLIETTGSYGGWSGNVRSWMARRTPTVVVRFDDLIARPMEELRRAMTAIGITAPETGVTQLPSFAELQKIGPQFFRKGRSGAWHEDMPDDLHLSFWRRHGDTMRALGYCDAEPAAEEFAGARLAADETLSFAAGHNGCAALGNGWGEPEAWGTWSIDRRAALQLAVGRDHIAPIEIALFYRSFVEGARKIEIVCRAAGEPLASWTCSVENWCGVKGITIPARAVSTDGVVTLEFEISDPVSPAQLGLSPDTRPLGLGIESMRRV